jgi:outer membrane protein OmpA-like peptidoglycan-associated protein
MDGDENSADGLGHALTDLMTSIAVIFILLFVAFLRNEQVEIADQKNETVDNRAQILQALTDEFGENFVKAVEGDPLTLQIVLDDKMLKFAYNRARVRSEGEEFLSTFIPQLAVIVCSEGREPLIDSIIIEGHTDSNGSHDHNTELSAERATAVLVKSRRILEDSGMPSTNELQGCFLRLSQATGRGKQEPVFNDGVEDKDASRRVVVKVRVKSMEQREDAERAASTG